MLRKNEHSLGGSNTLDTLTGGKNSQTSGAVRISHTVGLHTLPVGVGRVARNTVADLVAKGVISENSVTGNITISASIGSQ